MIVVRNTPLLLWRWFKRGAALAFVGALAYLIAWPSPIDALEWDAPTAPAMTGLLSPNNRLKTATLLSEGKLQGAEDIAIDAAGVAYGGLADGSIVRLGDAGDLSAAPVVVASTGGRPLGMKFAPDGTLWICDSAKGLLKLAFSGGEAGKPEVVLSEAAGQPIRFADDLDIATTGEHAGTIYFTDASSKWREADYVLEGLESRAYGAVNVLVKDAFFPNGVALNAAQDALLYSETYRYRIKRVWLSGAKKGTDEVWLDNLPGFPDNINSDGQDTLWVAFPSPRKADMDAMASRPWLRNIVAKLPRALLPAPVPMGFVAAYDLKSSALKQALFDNDGRHLRMITSATPHRGKLYLGSLESDRVGLATP
jgi:sugar lactone lactonase YvrE